MNNAKDGLGLKFIKKAHCYRKLVCDVEPGACAISGNMCKYCYDKRFNWYRESHAKRGSKIKLFSLDTLRTQLSNPNTLIRKHLDAYGVVRIGALGDMRPESYERYRLLMQMIVAHGYKYILVTKSSHSVSNSMLEDIALHDGILQVSLGFYSSRATSVFESAHIIPPSGRRNVVGRAIDRGVNTILRLNPVHPSYMDEHFKVIKWFSDVGGTRIIIETLRLDPPLTKEIDADFSKFVGFNKGGIYRGYLTLTREDQNMVLSALSTSAKLQGITKITVCGDMEGNDLYSTVKGDCCQACDILGVEPPPPDWLEPKEEDDTDVM